MAYYYTPPYGSASKPIGVNRIEYAEKNQILKLENEIKDLEIRENAIVKAVGKNQRDIEEIFSQLGEAYKHIAWLEQEVYKMQEKRPITVAPVVNKRRRRVTVCAYGQKVEIEKI
jgi:hypothetical protein